jgi:cysteine sulfinate desulfinase/cysteine desulfurase-like protein
MGRDGPAVSNVRAAVVSATYSANEHKAVADVLRLVGSNSGFRMREPDDGSCGAVVVVPLDPAAMPTSAVLHCVVDVLVELGWTVAVGAALSPRVTDPGVTHVGDALTAAGYIGVTAAGSNYDAIDLSSESVPAPCPPSSVLSGQPVSSAWARAALRIVLARWTDTRRRRSADACRRCWVV